MVTACVDKSHLDEFPQCLDDVSDGFRCSNIATFSGYFVSWQKCWWGVDLPAVTQAALGISAYTHEPHLDNTVNIPVSC